MAPEQLQHKPVSAQSDIYALGLTAYEALTRRQPFRGATESDVVQAILNYVPPPASS
jgi:serine/threonine-protein kinase